MYTVLVVDDEPRQRKTLSNVIREYRKEYEVLEAKNGAEALALCKERKMDFVFSDIRMPKMDGLSMIERIHQVNPHSRIVVVSGYSDFNYARKALDLRVYGYILKPIDSSAIWDIMLKMEEDILSARNSENEKNVMTEQLNLLLPFYRDHLMSKWIKGECTHAELAEVEGVLGYRGSGYIILTRMISYASKHGDSLNTSEEMEEIRLNVKKCVSEVLHPHGHILSFFWQYDTDCMVSLLKYSMYDKDGLDNMMKELQMLTDNVFHEYAIALSIGTGTFQEDIFTSVQKAYRTADAALRCHFYMNNGQIVRYTDIQHRYLDKLKVSFPFEDDLKQFVHGLSSLNAGILDTGLKLLLDDHYPNPESLLDHICSLTIRLHHSIQHIVSEETDGQLIQKINNTFRPSSCTSLSQLKRKWNQILIEMANAVQLQKDNKNSIIMERCLQYIHSHYGEELALEDLSQKYYFNPSYFSTLFKRYTGKHFTAYITDLRLGIAHKKLLESDKKVYEVAKEVGYRDVKYFNKIFKKHYGLTPNECRTFNTERNMA